MVPPSTPSWIKVDRASSTRSSAFAMHRRASLDASESSLNAVNNASSVDRFPGDDRYSELERFLPRFLTANNA